MKTIILLLSLMFFGFGSLNGQSGLWMDVPETQIELVGNRYIIPFSYRTVRLNLETAQQLLENAPIEFSEGYRNAFVIPLPMPDGAFQNFYFWESPTMEEELQAKFPEIRTYTGQGIDDPYATLKFDLTPHGFHAQILSPNGRVFIDPYSQGDIYNYISYYTKDFVKDADFICNTEFDEYEPHYDYESILIPTGPQLRTYRLANAATGEYTIFHGGTVALGLAAVTTSVNRVNGIYEREVAVRLVLIANNNLIIYTDPNTDPYSNTNGSAMLTQNISTLNSVIGSSNFDIGHVFSTGGGGVAYLGVVCGTNKAGGVTGQSQPIGDPFDVDYVAHEMGHQFNARHTFNGNAGSCSGNRTAATAYEPGSGSTIMAYAGICGTQNLQSNSDAYFHTISFDEIVAFTNTGGGNSCAVITSTGNSAPVVTVPSGGFYIPISTPFSLTGSATDPNSDPLTYCWEQFDLGNAGHPNSPVGNAPIFRSFMPVSSPTRTFPKQSDLLNNTQTIGEILPTYTRNLTFRLTVRDNRAGGGGVDWRQIAFFADGNSGPFIVTSPNTNVSWVGNSQQTVTWNVANTNASPVNCSNVRILLSTDGGVNFNTVLLASTPNDGSEVVTIPNFPTTQARIKVEAVGNVFFDISNVNFTIVNSPLPQDPAAFNSLAAGSSQINLTFTPNAGNNNVVIVWNNSGTFTTPSGPPPSVGNAFAGGILLYNGTSSPVIHQGLVSNTTYYYKAFSYNGSNYSSGTTSASTTFNVLNPAEFLADAINANEILLEFAPNIVDNNVVIVWNNSGTFSTPSGPPPVVGQTFAGGTLFYTGTSSPQSHTGLTPATTYYYRAFSFDGYNYSSGISRNATTPSAPSTFQLSVEVFNGWNMVSVPGLHPANQNVNTWWPGKDPSAGVFQFSGGYNPVITVTPGTGYWMKHIGNNTYNTGDEWPAGGIQIVQNDPIPGITGWNLIGGYHLTVATAGLTTTPVGLISGQVFGYTPGSGYAPATNLTPGYGYWIKLTGAGDINLPTSLTKSAPVSEYIKSDWGRIILTDAAGKSYTLYSVNGEIDLTHYELPPLPPAGMFDVRYGSQRLAEVIGSEIQTVEMQGIEYPVTVRVEGMTIRVQDETGKIVNQVIKSGEDVVISNPQVGKLKVSGNVIPETFSLEQNYPNPFNPSTVISYQLPVNGDVTLVVHDILGTELSTLVDEHKPAGRYKVTFDASGKSSGIYFYTLQAGSYKETKKMILLR